MPRLSVGCSLISCISPRKRKTFAINEKHENIETNKVPKENVQNIRILPSTKTTTDRQNKQTIFKRTTKSNCDSVDRDGNSNLFTSKQRTQTNGVNRRSNTKANLSEIFQKSKGLATPSPLPLTVDERSETNYDETTGSTSSDWSTSTSSDSNQNTKVSKHRSHNESYNLAGKSIANTKNVIQTKSRISYNQCSTFSKLTVKDVGRLTKNRTIKDSARSNKNDSSKL